MWLLHPQSIGSPSPSVAGCPQQCPAAISCRERQFGGAGPHPAAISPVSWGSPVSHPGMAGFVWWVSGLRMPQRWHGGGGVLGFGSAALWSIISPADFLGGAQYTGSFGERWGEVSRVGADTAWAELGCHPKPPTPFRASRCGPAAGGTHDAALAPFLPRRSLLGAGRACAVLSVQFWLPRNPFLGTSCHRAGSCGEVRRFGVGAGAPCLR